MSKLPFCFLLLISAAAHAEEFCDEGSRWMNSLECRMTAEYLPEDLEILASLRQKAERKGLTKRLRKKIENIEWEIVFFKEKCCVANP